MSATAGAGPAAQLLVRPFPDEEYAARFARLKQALEPLAVDAVLVQGTRNWYRDHAIRYLCGYDSPASASLLYLPLSGGEPVLVITDAWDLERARSMSWVGDVRAAGDIDAALGLLSSRIQSDKRLGIAGGECMGFTAMDVLPRRVLEAIRAAAPATELVDAGGALLSVRTIRSAAEIGMLRQAGKLADAGAQAFFATARAGVSERDLWSEIWYAMQNAGAHDLHISFCRGPGSFWPHPPSDDVLADGDIVSVELSPRINGYFSQANRMCFVGGNGREWADLERLSLGALALAKSLMKPGVRAKDVVAGVSALVARSPLATMDMGGVHRIGHGCGIALDEGPFLTSASASELQADMTMALHPMIYLPYRHSLVMTGDYVRITETGLEVLTEPQSAIPAV
ncbi:MAG: aminopeptidase P family protein [Betaproteobacteria bacterium]|nr:aminopeptidase P family protein [Betaproteobacteria bacterium]